MGDSSAQLIWVDAYAVRFHRLAAGSSVFSPPASASRDVLDLVSCYPLAEITLCAKHLQDFLVSDSNVAQERCDRESPNVRNVFSAAEA